ncbi:MAG: hypothetical protein WC901_06800 [Candidatus Margulisiibacteriota bacterium]
MFPLAETIKQKYLLGKSAKEIAAEMGFSEHKICYWLEKTGTKKRSRSEATYLKRNPSGDPFKIVEQITYPKDLMLFFVAIGLYLGEGAKKGRHRVALGNTDPKILKAFLFFIRKICRLREEKIFAELNIFDDIDKDFAVEYWARTVGIAKEQVKYVCVRKSKGGTYKNKSKYGTLTIKVSNTKLKQIILEWCRLIINDCSMPV